ncbi:MAG TPA: class I lanthipeptide [Thermoanaerobaculia bacterium]|nr:class I lanthipeptide [Thermoanaerobaculia bacterium]
MKKQVKKLVLAKETVRNLEKGELGRVAGGASVYCTDTYCPSGVPTCGTCACGPTQTGTSRYC